MQATRGAARCAQRGSFGCCREGLCRLCTEGSFGRALEVLPLLLRITSSSAARPPEGHASAAKCAGRGTAGGQDCARRAGAARQPGGGGGDTAERCRRVSGPSPPGSLLCSHAQPSSAKPARSPPGPAPLPSIMPSKSKAMACPCPLPPHLPPAHAGLPASLLCWPCRPTSPAASPTTPRSPASAPSWCSGRRWRALSR